MQSTDVKYEFRKTARHEITDGKAEAEWHHFGRYMCIFGVKKPGPFNREKRSIRIFSLMATNCLQLRNLPSSTTLSLDPVPKHLKRNHNFEG